MTPTLEQGVETAKARLAAKNEKQRMHDAAFLLAVGEMMLNPKKLEFALWLKKRGRISDYD